jgi:L,D-transpeptidase catalytic domain
MNTIKFPVCRCLLMMLVLIAPATLVEGKKEVFTGLTIKTSVSTTYHSSDVIKKMLNYKVSAAAVCARTAEMAQAIKLAAINAELKMAAIKAEVKMAALKAELNLVNAQARGIYEDMDLGDSGLSKKAFEYAWLGYHKLQKRGLLHRTGILSICDFSQSSSRERMYVIDVLHKKLLFRTYVAHGINSGEEYANSFSNQPESCKSSLGFYVTRQTYYGINGLSLKIDGLDKGFNDMANARNIVIHGASYVSTHILQKYGVMGTTFGCPAIPTEMSTQIIPLVKNGTCFFIYYPSKKYLAGSMVLNG